MINVTDTAAQHLKGISEANGGKIPMLGLKGGGCAGFAYTWSLKEELELDKKTDHVIILNNGAKMAVPGTSIMYLIGTTLELKQDTFGTSLEIVNPNSASECGCGESVNFDAGKVEANKEQIAKSNGG